MSSSNNEHAVHATGLVKRFGDLTAVDGLDLRVRTGTCLAVLGPNGAGKTTTIEMLEGLTDPDEGSIEVLGLTWDKHADEIRRRIGVQLQETKLPEKSTVGETLALFRSFYETGRTVDEALELVELTDKRKARVEHLSGGQHQRLNLACALINHPAVLFLDEPTTGLDPQARRRVWSIAENFKRDGGTLLLTTHYMEEAQRLADEVVIVDAGRVVTVGTPQALISGLDAENIVEISPADKNGTRGTDLLAVEALQALPGVREVRQEGASITLSVTDTQQSVSALLAHLREVDVALEALHTHAPTLEDVFMDLTGKHLRDD